MILGPGRRRSTSIMPRTCQLRLELTQCIHTLRLLGMPKYGHRSRHHRYALHPEDILNGRPATSPLRPSSRSIPLLLSASRTMTLLTDPVGDPLGNTIAAIDPLSCLLPSGVDGCGRRSEWKKFRHHGTRLKRLAKMQPNLRGPVNAKTLNPIA